MSKSRSEHLKRARVEPKATSTQNVEAAREDGSADHKKALHEAKIPTKPESTVDADEPMATTSSGKDR